MKKKPIRLLLFVLFSFNTTIFSLAQQSDPVIKIIKSEMEREFKILSQQPLPAYYIDYRVEETKAWYIYSNFGNIITSDSSIFATISPNLRVGTPAFDNQHTIKGDPNRIQYLSASFPIEVGEDAMRQIMWDQTNGLYKQIRTTYQSKKNKIKVEDEKQLNDFVSGQNVKYIENRIDFSFTKEKIANIEKMAKTISAEFLRDIDISQGVFSFSFEIKRKYFVSSENQLIVQNFPAARIIIAGSIKSSEGNEMPLIKSYFSFDMNKLPGADSLHAVAKLIVDKLIELKNAPLAEAYTGPAILSPEASGVFFHEIFGHRVEGHRLKDETDAQTFKNKIGEKVLPLTFSVVFNPQEKQYKTIDLNGYYKYDDQGVEGQKVTVVEDGILKDYLMCRTPIDGFPNSNGHGRGDIRRGTVSRQSNMFVSTSKPYSSDDLKKLLVTECKKQGLEYGYFFKEVTGGFTSTGRYMPNAFNVTPTEVYKVYTDGRPDQLVRGVDLVGTPLSMFSTISAAGNDWGIFNGTCGAESGGVPVATVSPSIFVEKIETQKKIQKFSNGPILNPPSEKNIINNN